ncbi:gluzincin family metallopeptidase [Flavobacterium daemonense]|uniref:M1 family metallopeptidase n=1 Tax=Flavobacterium daemonense TaxID=1393049 RepID=UPI00118651B1|nr:M1 family metallopeptidase [Flavobacterium daemonense]KAF2330721.1 M1 family metallopeptidase [Flavobacterium daemonense]
MEVAVNLDLKTLNIRQDITFYNTSNDSLISIVLNDWNNAFSDKNTPLARRFSDEFYRGFHVAKPEERGNTTILSLTDSDNMALEWERTEKNPDFVVVKLNRKLRPGEKIDLHLTYIAKIPSAKFTHYGFDQNGGMNLKNWFLSPARFENHRFVKNNNFNLDDIANAVVDYQLEIKLPTNYAINTDLNSVSKDISNSAYTSYVFSGNERTDFSLIIEKQNSFRSYTNGYLEVLSDLKIKKLNEIQRAIVINRVASFANEFIGKYPHEKIIVSQADYDRNPFYGLNQLPSFISPFSDEFIFEITFLKTYLNNYLKNSLRLNPRKDNWVYDGIQIYAMMKYMEENHLDQKMLGRLSDMKLFKSYNITNLTFNEQYSYYYMLMARKNLDQPLGDPKNTLIKFNEQIASKYRAGLSLSYLDDYLDHNIVPESVQEFYALNKTEQTNRYDFEKILTKNSTKNIDWFFRTIIESRDIIDYKFSDVSRTKDSVQFSIKNITGVYAPIPVYGMKKNEVVFKEWIEPKTNDSVYEFSRKNADKLVLNYDNEVPEYNQRNNWKSLKSIAITNRPIKFNFAKDLEDPYYNQILYIPTLTYNYYDGFTPGIRFHNKTILDKPFTFDVNPAYSIKAQTISGSSAFSWNQYYRHSTLYNVRYSISQNYFHYAPDAAYLRLNPMVQLRIREENFRDNRKQLIMFRQVIVNREASTYITDNSKPNYSIFNARYSNTKTELINHFSYMNDIQFSGDFGKLSGEVEYRRLFENNHKLNLRLYAGTFLYNTTNSDYFSFGLDRPTDYLFDYNLFGRSESTGFFSQQYVIAEGGFKSQLEPSYANQWMTTLNASYAVWNWVEVYGDIGFLKNKHQSEFFAYDSGIRLNLVPDYFELYFPVYSNNGWEITQSKYNEKIRFVITFSPKTLVNLFTRKWF